ncbi:acyl-CoA synthetase (AMP-forming)/AMP-acid ligase II [Amycolatopsis lexingtonensis]|uniref:Acyl-CoA synthetase (AMP-forming)/AMP-acid ligase II n=1 Tax=Amycolatopsis lexingtonensis TaxID=218822 RepID=A0ABR9HPX7_9PSEU|nr:AMP-binding protein [Amycolatopsis lexingtonensis]MBE1492979.1 acyl-CoA synthetase (AMP-forming)/AMP-acid ligase II [Amycolatopsis lexingtonensis]
MRDDVVEASAVVGHTPDVVWQIVGSPEWYARFVPEISWCEVQEPASRGRGPKGVIRIVPERGPMLEAQVQAVVYRPGEHVVWCGVPDDGTWVSLELRPLAGGKTELFVRMMLPPAYLDLVSSIKKDVRALARRLDLHLAGQYDPDADRDGNKATKLRTTSVLLRAGVLSPARPDKLARQLQSLAQWGATVAGGYQAAAGRVPDEPALHDERNLRTFRQVQERSNRLANALSELGVAERDRIALMCRNHSAMVESFVAASKLGADVVLLNTGLSAASVKDVLAEHKPSAVLADDEFAQTIANVPGDFARISTWPDADAGYPTVDELIHAAPADPPKPVERPGRLVVLTSGTTGTPKGARRPTPKGLGSAAAILDRIPLRASDRILVAAPLFHSWGLAAMQLGMALRASLALTRKFDAEETLRTIAEQKCDALFVVPIMLQRIMDLPERVRARYDLSSLRIVASSGSAMSGAFVTSFMDTFGDVLYNFYGSTEVSWASIADPADLRAAPTTAGRCLLGTRLAILDEDRKPVPPGGEGQIFVGNDMLFDGYTNGTDPARAADLMATGDVGYLDAAGRLFVTGRADEMIVSGGENVFPRPVEEALVALPGVHDAAVVGVADAEWGQRLAAYVVPRRGASLHAEDIRAYIHQRLARFAVPRDVYFVPDLPRNATGKILKRLLHDDTWPATSEY